MKKWVITCILICSYALLFADSFSGFVFLDENKNGTFDQTEKGIHHVVVSNGLECVSTDENGFYELPLREDCVVFITKPVGYITPVNKSNIPQFYYIHYPQGSPELNYPAIQPTGELPDQINFPLYKSTFKGNFEILAIGDPQTKTAEQIDYLRDDIYCDLVNSTKEFAIILGDIMDNDISLFPYYLEVCEHSAIPLYHVPGNHDLNFAAESDKHSLDTYISHFGPSYYSFNYGEVHFVVLDTVEYTGNNSYFGNIGETQLKWLENDLSFVPEDHLIVISMHIPLYSNVDNPGKDHVRDRAELFQVLNGREKILILAGHTHTLENVFLSEEDGWQGTKPIHIIIGGAACGCWWGGPFDERGIPYALQGDGVPNGYNLLDFKGSEYTHLYQSANMDATYQVRISSPRGNVKKKMVKYTDIYANVFNAGYDSEIYFSIDNSEFALMKKKAVYDPYTSQVYRDALTYSSPKLCEHLFMAPLPSDLEEGMHKIIVKYTDRYGVEFSDSLIFKIY
ncbi:MAG TPA: calcineurin-like phosphoesterase family protein [Bacteroidales bacterium]|nr:calcineurin-like phosphoesterase family protein [Bacteroidales bacterium]HRW34074.1 calcineurin-like phosphoesterase family protein [Thermotogota bacterium]